MLSDIIYGKTVYHKFFRSGLAGLACPVTGYFFLAYSQSHSRDNLDGILLSVSDSNFTPFIFFLPVLVNYPVVLLRISYTYCISWSMLGGTMRGLVTPQLLPDGLPEDHLVGRGLEEDL